jgi:DNA-directed RNA polymerase II subunit RPB1
MGTFVDKDDTDPNESAVNFIKEAEDHIINDLTIKGLREISKVFAKKYDDTEYDPVTGAIKRSSDNWMLETDGIALQKILSLKKVDYKKTISNDINEVL